MKKLYGWVMAWGLYWVGDLVSKPMCWCDLFAYAYPFYNWLMLKSADYQDEYDLAGPWDRTSEGAYEVYMFTPGEDRNEKP